MSVFGNPELLEERVEIIDTPELVRESQRIEAKLDSWLGKKTRTNMIVAYLGGFGTGKSMTLQHLSKLEKYEWLNFEIWRYSDRQQIWDGFVIEAAAKIRQKSKGDSSAPFEDIAREIEDGRTFGKVSKVSDWCAKHVGTSMLLALSCWLLGLLVWWLLYGNKDQKSLFMIAVLKYALPILFVGLAFLGIGSIVPRPQKPLRRVFQLEKKLLESLRKLTKPLVVVVEDVDRSSNDEGIIFLETLRTFLKERVRQPTQPIIVIAPQSNRYFNLIDYPDAYERSLKIYDQLVYYAEAHLDGDKVTNYLRKLEVNVQYRDKFIEIVKTMVTSSTMQVSMRKLKFILRAVDEFCDAFPTANPAIAFILLASRHSVVANGRDGQKQEAYKILASERKIWFEGELRSPAVFFVEQLAELAPSGWQEGFRRVTIKYQDIPQEIEIVDIPNGMGRVMQHNMYLDKKYLALVEDY